MARRTTKRKNIQRSKRSRLKQKHDPNRLVPWAIGIFVLVIVVVSINAPQTGLFTGTIDTDGDGLLDTGDISEETFGSDPNNEDTDGDGCLDGYEAFVSGTDVLTADCDPLTTESSDFQ